MMYNTKFLLKILVFIFLKNLIHTVFSRLKS
ncbi:MAG: hypothetical protein ACJA0E_000463 [Bermanella sp.]|jgi:hypothetical protein